MDNSQIVTVESSNTSYADNTNSFFKVRLPQTLNFGKAHELGLLDVSIPATVHNVRNDAYFAFVMYRATPEVLAKKSVPIPEPLIETSASERSEVHRSVKQFEGHLIEGYVKFKIQRGYYTSPEELLDTILEDGKQVLDHHKPNEEYLLTKNWAGDISAVSKLIDNSAPGIFIFNYEDYNYANIKRVIGNIFTSTLGRCKFKPHIGLLRIYPLKIGSKAKRVTTSMHFSEDIAYILGQPAKKAFYLSRALQKSQYSNFLCRVQPTDTIYLYCPELMESVVSDIKTPILRILAFSARKLGFGDMYHQSFKNPIYVELNTRRLTELTFELRGVDGKPIAFMNSTYPVRLTLCIREKHRQ